MKPRDALATLGIALDALPLIAKMANVGGDRAQSALVGIRAALSAITDGLDGKATAQEMLSRIETLSAELQANDSAADAALAKKFRGG